MLFSIIIPVYNGDRYLKECLDSLDSQTFSDYEIIIVDDGSTDNSKMIATSFASQRDYCSVVSTENEGPFLARRRGLSHSRGQYVLFLDSDDALRSDALEIVAKVVSESQADIVSFRYARRPDFSVADDVPVLQPGLYGKGRWEKVCSAVLQARFNNLWGKAIRLSCIDIEENYNNCGRLTMGEDLLQLLPIIDNSRCLIMINDILYYYRTNTLSSSSIFKTSYILNIECVAQRVIEFAKRWNMVEEGYRGALQLYVNLAHLLSDSAGKLGRRRASNELQLLGQSIRRVIVDAEEVARGMRADNGLCIWAVLHGRLSVLRLGTAIFHVGRNVLHRSV